MGRESQRLGKRGEYTALGRMLDLGLDVYVPVVDVENIDFVVRNNKGRYKAIQIKTRARKKGGETFEITLPKLSHDFFVVLHIAGTENFRVLPFKVFYRYRVRSEYFKKRGKVRLLFTKKKKEVLHRYRGDFAQLK